MKSEDRIKELKDTLIILNKVMDQIAWCQLKLVDYSKPLRDQLEIMIRTREDKK